MGPVLRLWSFIVPQLLTFPGQGGWNKKDAAIGNNVGNMCELCMEFSKSSALAWVSVAVVSSLVEMMIHVGAASWKMK